MLHQQLRRFLGLRHRTTRCCDGPASAKRPSFRLEALEPRHLLAGDFDPTFGGGGPLTLSPPDGRDEEIAAAVEQPDGKLVLAGTSNVPTGADRDFLIARLNPDGTPDETFGTGGYVRVGASGVEESGHDVAVDSQGRIIVAGKSGDHLAVTRVDRFGVLDTNFGVGGIATLELMDGSDSRGSIGRALTLTADGGIAVAGQALASTNFSADILLAKFNANGGLSPTFAGGDGYATFDYQQDDDEPDDANDIAVQDVGSEQMLVLAGSVDSPSGPDQFAVLRFDSDGDPDSSFGSSGLATTDFGDTSRGHRAYAVAIDAGNQIVVAGDAQKLSQSSNVNVAVARFDVSGDLDPAFHADATTPGTLRFSIDDRDETRGVAIQPDGSIVVAGNADFSFAVARVLSNGTLDTDDDNSATDFSSDGKLTHDFPNHTIARGHDVLVTGGGRILVVGNAKGDSTLPVEEQNQNLALAQYQSGLPAPTADAGPPAPAAAYTVTSDGTVVLSGTATDPDDGAADLVNEWDLDGDGVFGETGAAAVRGDEIGATPTYDAAGMPTGPQFVTLRVTDPSGFWHADVARIDVVVNSPPLIDVLNTAVTIDEGTVAANSGSFSDPDGHAVTLSASLGVVVDDGNGMWSWSYDATDDLATTTVSVTATDQGGESTSVDFDLTVNNVAPTADAGGPYESIPGETVVLDATGSSDPAGPADPLTFAWDFDEDEVFDDATGANPVYDPAAYGVAPGETGVVAVRVSDGDGGTDIATTTVTVAGPGVVLTDGVLFAIGSVGDDSVTMEIVDGQLVVTSSLIPGGSTSFDPDDVDLIVVNASDGDDVISILDSVPIDAQISGGAGNDFLVSGGGNDLVRGGSGTDLILTQSGDDVALGGSGSDYIFTGFGDDVIMGGDGADQLFGGAGRDLIIGGDGSDWLWGGEEEDLLIGASTVYDDYDDQTKMDAVDDIMAVWTSGDTYDGRVGTLEASGLLDPQTAISNDDDFDVFVGGGGLDLYFAELGDFVLFGDDGEETVLV